MEARGDGESLLADGICEVSAVNRLPSPTSMPARTAVDVTTPVLLPAELAAVLLRGVDSCFPWCFPPVTACEEGMRLWNQT